MEGEVEADDRRCRILGDPFERLHVERVHGEDVPVRPVTGRRRGTPEGPVPVVVAYVERAADVGRRAGSELRHV